MTGSAPLGAAMSTAVVGAVAVEALRGLRRNEVDVLMAILFAGGIAGGVVLISAMPPGRAANLDAYLFGAIVTTTRADLVVLAGTAAVVLAFTVGLCRAIFAVSIDEECARAAGLPVTVLNMLLAATTAATVVASMRIVGLLLIGALMVLPAAAAMLVARNFRGTLLAAVGIGAVVASAGTTAAYYLGVPAGGTIMLLAVTVFTVSTAGPGARRAARRVLAAAGRRAAARPADSPWPVVHSRVGLLP